MLPTLKIFVCLLLFVLPVTGEGECILTEDEAREEQSLNRTDRPAIQNNTISQSQIICEGDTPQSLMGSDPSGGNGTFSYLWETSTDLSMWNVASGINNDKNYSPGALFSSAYFRRIIFSGVETDTSNLLSVYVHPLPTAVISGSDIICRGEKVTIQVEFTGVAPWTFTYYENTIGITEKSTESIKNLIKSPSFDVVYTLYLVTDSMGCEADILSGSATVNVIDPAFANAGHDTTVCSSGVDLHASSLYGSGKWSSGSGGTFSPDALTPAAHFQTDTYGEVVLTWKVSNIACADSDQVKITFYEQPSIPDAGDDQFIGYAFQTTLHATPASAGTGAWSVIEGTGTFSDSGNPMTMVTKFSHGNNIFRWTVTNGTCPAMYDDVLINVDYFIIPEGFSPNGDNKNDRFVITGIELFPENELKVYNRWGNEVHSFTGYNNEWEGKNKSGQDLPDDTYYYTLDIAGKIHYNGYIILKR